MSHLEYPFQVSSASGAWLSANGFDQLERCEMLGSGHHECYLLGNRIGVNGTPALYSSDGGKFNGYVPYQQLIPQLINQ